MEVCTILILLILDIKKKQYWSKGRRGIFSLAVEFLYFALFFSKHVHVYNIRMTVYN